MKCSSELNERRALRPASRIPALPIARHLVPRWILLDIPLLAPICSLCDPPGVEIQRRFVSGDVATLHPRLMAATPPGSRGLNRGTSDQLRSLPALACLLTL